MRMERFICNWKKAFVMLLGGISILFVGCGVKADENIISGNYKIFQATDLHFLSPELNDNGSFFTEMMAGADGKMTGYSDEITDAFINEVIEEKPDCLVLSGDLTFNGEKGSHMALADKLRRVEEAGITVLVIPGNHDINKEGAASFQGDSYTLVESVRQKEFEEIYSDFGVSKAISRSETSFSYTYDTGTGYWILCVDSNTEERPGSVDDQTLKWIEKQLREAEKRGVRVLAVSHQNLLVHSKMFSFGYQIYNGDELFKLYKKYKVALNLSGHMHLQHLMQEASVTEIATSSLTVYNCQYGIVELSAEGINYNTQNVDVDSWAKAQGKSDPDLLNFKNYASDYFDVITGSKLNGQLENIGFSEEEVTGMIHYAQNVNKAYFSGRLDQLPQEEEVFKLWQQDGLELFFSSYLSEIQNEEKKNHNVFHYQYTDIF